MSLNDKTILITGGSSGIGRATALLFGREGARVVIADLDEAGGDVVVEEVKSQGGQAIYVHTDVSDGAQVERMVSAALAEYGALDYAFNNAGVAGEQRPLAEYSDEAWAQVIAVNLSGVRQCMKYELRHMAARKQGVIVNCASTAGLVGFPNLSAYVAAKHGVVGLTRAAALEYAGLGIRVNVVCPGIIETPLSAPVLADPRYRQHMIATHPLGRIGQPEEIAQAVLWLCRDATYVTGHALAVDGGYVAQ